MAFLNERCPNCGKSLSKQAQFCNECGAESATAWTNCVRCRASIGSDSRFCWKCGGEQDLNAKRAVYGDRWFRSAKDFAIRVELSTPGESLRHGIQVDEGTLALMFQDGRLKGTLAPGYHSTDSFLQRLLGFNPGSMAYVILLDARSAEIDFELDRIRVAGSVPVNVRVRLMFRVADPTQFVASVVRDRSSFASEDLVSLFHQDVSNAVQQRLREVRVEDLLVEPRAREMLEKNIHESLGPVARQYGLQMDGVRLAQFGGEAVDYLAEKLGELNRSVCEHEVNRRLRDALRAEKADAYRDERELEEVFERVNREYGLRSAEREEERKRFMQVAEHEGRRTVVVQEYDLRRAEIQGRIDEQKLKHESELAEVSIEIQKRVLRLDADLSEAQKRAAQSRELVREQAKVEAFTQELKSETDVKSAGMHWDLARKIKEDKARIAAEEERRNLEGLREKVNIMGGASHATLLAVLGGEQADRILKLAELEMRRGLGAEEALALVVEKSPEIAPAIAEALKAKYAGRAASESPTSRQP
ncbi:MAG: hypothetical protein RLZZ244_2094 [Verrucomicrobiota bacterium]|jgi:hypothetical protein